MKKSFLLIALLTGTILSAQAQNNDISKDVETDEVVVTGTRNSTDIRHLPMTTSLRSLRAPGSRCCPLPGARRARSRFG